MPARTAQCAMSTMQKLAWSYLDRAAAGDFARASIVLSKFATTYVGVRAQIAEASGVRVDQLPPRLEQFFSPNTAGVLGFVLSAAAISDAGRVVHPELRSGVLAIQQQTAASVGQHFRTAIAPYKPSGANLDAFVSLVQTTDPDRLGIALDGAIAEGFECASATGFDELISSLANPPSRPSSNRVTELAPTVIRASGARPGVPTWALYGIGAVAVGLAGWALWRAA